MFNKEQLLVMCNIIAAVETENQTYHTRETATGYGDFTEAYANSSAEVALTIGRYQHFQNEALKLLKLIYSRDKSLFTQELINDMNTGDWTYYNISKNSSKAQTIIKIISSDIGKECQDELVSEQMQEYAKHAESLGVTDVWAQAMCANFEHQGGSSCVSRILAKTKKPYTIDNLYEACSTDTGNQVGVYRNRQRTVVSLIKQYMPKDSTTTQTTYVIDPGITAEDALKVMRSWIGLNQFDGSHMKIVNIYNAYRPLARSYQLSSTDSWCAGTISALFISLNAVDLIGGTECGVERFIEDVFKPKGIWIEDGTITPQPGDIITFNWDSSVQDNTGFADHIGIVEYVENGIVHTIEGNSSGRVARRTYAIGHGNIRGYARPQYGKSSTTIIEEPTVVDSGVTHGVIVLKKGVVSSDVKKLQTMLIYCGYSCGSYGADGDFGDATESALKKFQKDHGIEQTGEYWPDTMYALEQAYGKVKNLKEEVAVEELEKEEAITVMYTKKKPFTPLRKGTAKSKPIIKELLPGTEVEIIKKKITKTGKLWYKVKVDGVTGWIVATSLRDWS